MNDEAPEKYRRWVADNFASDVKEQLFDIYKESLYDDQDGSARIAKTIAKACTLMARLSADQERTAKKIVRLTWGLIGLTVALLAFTVYLYKDTHLLVEREQAASSHGSQSRSGVGEEKAPNQSSATAPSGRGSP